MRLYLVRHGQTSWNISGQAQGHTDISLDPTGLDQADRLATFFETRTVDRILSSDLARCKETAGPIARATGAPLELTKDLRERGFGAWEGLPFTDVGSRLHQEAARLGVSAQEVRPPGGESFADVWKRLDAIHEMMRTTDEDLAVISHGGALSLLLAKLIKGTLDTARAFRFANTGVTELERRIDGLFLITQYNETSHLATERALSGSLDGVSR